MTGDQLETLVGKAGMYTDLMHMGAASLVYSPGCKGVNLTELKLFVALVEQHVTEAWNRRAPEPVGHEARRRAYQEGHRDGMEEAAQYLDGLHRTANKQHNYYQYAANCIRLATKPAQEPNRSQKMHEAGYTRRPSPFGCEECGVVFGGVAQLQAHDCTKPAQEGDHD